MGGSKCAEAVESGGNIGDGTTGAIKLITKSGSPSVLIVDTKYKICIRFVMDTSDPSIKFSNEPKNFTNLSNDWSNILLCIYGCCCKIFNAGNWPRPNDLG